MTSARQYFIVGVREVHVSYRKVAATSSDEAMDKAKDLDGSDELSIEYSHTLDKQHWSVEGPFNGEVLIVDEEDT